MEDLKPEFKFVRDSLNEKNEELVQEASQRVIDLIEWILEQRNNQKLTKMNNDIE